MIDETSKHLKWIKRDKLLRYALLTFMVLKKIQYGHLKKQNKTLQQVFSEKMIWLHWVIYIPLW